MHTVEALLSAADVLDDPSLRERAQRILTRVVHDLARGNEWRIPEHFDARWTPVLDYNVDEPAHPFRPYGATIGHWLEWARLALHLRAGLGVDAPDWLLDDARSLFDAAVREGWAVDGADGFVYTVDWSGTPVVRERMHWVAAEATATAAALHAATGESSYDGWYTTWWQHVAECFLDRERGSWRHELSPTNRPSAVTWQGKPDTYHAFQATLLPRLPLSPTLATALRDGLLAWSAVGGGRATASGRSIESPEDVLGGVRISPCHDENAVCSAGGLRGCRDEGAECSTCSAAVTMSNAPCLRIESSVTESADMEQAYHG